MVNDDMGHGAPTLLIELSTVSDELCSTLLSGLSFHLGGCSKYLRARLAENKAYMGAVRLYNDPNDGFMLKGSLRRPSV